MPKPRDRGGPGLSRDAANPQASSEHIARLEALAAAESLDVFDAQYDVLMDLPQIIPHVRSRAGALRSISSALTTGYRLLRRRITNDLFRSGSSYAAGALGLLSASWVACLQAWFKEVPPSDFPEVSHHMKSIIVNSGLLPAYSAACEAVAALESKQFRDLSEKADVPVCPCCSAKLSAALLKLWPNFNAVWPDHLPQCDVLRGTVVPAATLAATAVRLWPSSDMYLTADSLSNSEVQDQIITQQCRRQATVMGLELVHEVLSAVDDSPLDIYQALEIFASKDFHVLLTAYLAWATKHEFSGRQEPPNTSSSGRQQPQQQIPPFHEHLLDVLQLRGLGDTNPLAGQRSEPQQWVPNRMTVAAVLCQDEPVMPSSAAVNGMATVQGMLQQHQLQQPQERMYLLLGPGFGSAMPVAAAAVPGIPTKHYPLLSLVVLESWTLHKDLECLDRHLLLITALVQRVGVADPTLVMHCAAVVLRAALLMLAPVLHEVFKDSQKSQQGATVAADGAAAAMAAWMSADPERQIALEMVRAAAAQVDIQDCIEECLQEAFDPEPLPSRAWKFFTKFVYDMMVLIPQQHWSSVLQHSPCNSLAHIEAAIRNQATTHPKAEDDAAACKSLILPAAQSIAWECIPSSMALSIDAATEAQGADTAAKVHAQLLSSMLTGLKVLAQVPTSHNNIFGVATTAASAADTLRKLFPVSLRAAAGAGPAHSSTQSASNSAAAQEQAPPAARTASAEYWSTWLTPDDGLYAATAPADCTPAVQLTAAANAGGITPWLVLVGRSLLVVSSMVTLLLQGQYSQQTLIAAPGRKNGEVAIELLEVCSDAIAWVATWMPADLPATPRVATMLAAAAEAREQLLQKLADLQGALSSKVEQAQHCTLAARQLQRESSAAALKRVWVGLQLPEQLQQLGEMLCQQLPTPLFCNNPGCRNLAKESELQLAKGKGCVCGGCLTAHYCGRECQTAHWPQHKPVCKRLKRPKMHAAVC